MNTNEKPQSTTSEYKPRVRRLCLFRKFRKSEDGTAMIEMGILALPFFFILGAFFELTMQYFALTIMKAGVADLARQVRTKQLVAPLTQAQIRPLVCNGTAHVMFNCGEMTIDVQEIPTWGGGVGVPTNGSGGLDTAGMGFNPGGATTISVIRAYYEWPTLMPKFLTFGYGGVVRTDPGTTLLVSTAAVRIEP